MEEETTTTLRLCFNQPNLVGPRRIPEDLRQPQARLASHNHGAERLQRKAVINGSSNNSKTHSISLLLSMVSHNLEPILLQMANLGHRHRIQDFYLGRLYIFITGLKLNQLISFRFVYTSLIPYVLFLVQT